MTPALLRLIRIYGPKILKILNKQSTKLPKIPAPKPPAQPKNLIEILTGQTKASIDFSRLQRRSVKESIKTIKEYPNIFRSMDPEVNIVNANYINKALKAYNPHKQWARSPNRFKMELPKKMSPLSSKKFKKITKEE
jgi:hypothetical protein